MCLQLLEDILTPNCDATIGFKSKIYIGYETDVNAIPAAVDGEVTTVITMVATKKFFEIPISTVLDKNSIVSEIQGDADSSVHRVTAEFFVPALTPKNNKIIGSLKGTRCIVVAPDKEGNSWILGEKNDGVTINSRLTMNGTTKGYTVTITGDYKNFPLSYKFNNGVPPTV